jgi:hypothetical protein
LIEVCRSEVAAVSSAATAATTNARCGRVGVKTNCRLVIGWGSVAAGPVRRGMIEVSMNNSDYPDKTQCVCLWVVLLVLVMLVVVAAAARSMLSSDALRRLSHAASHWCLHGAVVPP